MVWFQKQSIHNEIVTELYPLNCWWMHKCSGECEKIDSPWITDPIKEKSKLIFLFIRFTEMPQKRWTPTVLPNKAYVRKNCSNRVQAHSSDCIAQILLICRRNEFYIYLFNEFLLFSHEQCLALHKNAFHSPSRHIIQHKDSIGWINRCCE